MSPDGKNLYTASQFIGGPIAEFAVNSDGSLSQLAAPNNCIEEAGQRPRLWHRGTRDRERLGAGDELGRRGRVRGRAQRRVRRQSTARTWRSSPATPTARSPSWPPRTTAFRTGRRQRRVRQRERARPRWTGHRDLARRHQRLRHRARTTSRVRRRLPQPRSRSRSREQAAGPYPTGPERSPARGVLAYLRGGCQVTLTATWCPVGLRRLERRRLFGNRHLPADAEPRYGDDAYGGDGHLHPGRAPTPGSPTPVLTGAPSAVTDAGAGFSAT